MTDVVRDATTLTIRGARLCGYCDGTVAGDVGLAVRGAGGEWETLTLLSAQTDTLIATVAPDAPPVEAVRVQTPGGVTERALTH